MRRMDWMDGSSPATTTQASSIPPEAQISRYPAFPLRFRLIARFDPVRERLAPVSGTFSEPGEAARLAHLEQCPLHIVIDVAGEQEQPARLQQPVEVPQVLLRDEAAAVMARLGPRIGIEQID